MAHGGPHEGYGPTQIPPGGIGTCGQLGPGSGTRLPGPRYTPPTPTGGGGAGTALLATSAFSTIAGSVLSALASKQQAEAIQAAARYNAALAEMEGRAEEMRQRRIGRRALSSQFVQMAGKSGVIAEEGGWLEALTWNAAEYETNAVNAGIAGRNRAALERSRARVAGDVGRQRTGAALLSGATRLSGLGLSLASGGSYPTVAYTPGTSGSAP